MEKFTKLTAVAAPLPIVNCDTDKIIPARFLKTLTRTGLGKNLFDPLRYDPKTGEENPDFVLNKPAYRNSEILVAGHNFGCGSSREHAPWALLDFGIRCVISTDLLIKVSPEELEQLMEGAERGANATMTVDLESQEITNSDGEKIIFEVDSFKKHCLLNGLDDIGLTLKKESSISAYEEKQKASEPWLYA